MFRFENQVYAVYVFTGFFFFFFFFKCYYLFDWFVDLSVTYLEL